MITEMFKSRLRLKFLPILSTALLIVACSQQSGPALSSDDWVSLFDGKSFSGWEMKSEIAKRIWTIKDGVIDCQPVQGGKDDKNLWSSDEYGYRNNQKDPVIRAGVTPKKKADKPIGEWNAFHITMKGDRLTVALNGETVIENARLPGIPESGPIALQHHGGYNEAEDVWNGASSLVQFRNIKIKEL